MAGFERAMPKMPRKIRKEFEEKLPEMEQSMTTGMQQMQERMGKLIPGLAQRTWIEMLERKGIAALALDATTIEEARKEAAGKGAGFLLSSEISSQREAGPARQTARGRTVQTGKLSLSGRYSIEDAAGRALVPWQTVAESTTMGMEKGGEEEGGVDAGGPDEDVWAEFGDELVKAVASALPLGAVKYVEPSTYLPKIPDMAVSQRLDLTRVARQFFRGKAMEEEEEKPERAILEFAGGSISSSDRKMGVIYSPDAARFYVIDDKHKQYSTMNRDDFEAMALFAAGSSSGKGKLVRTGGSGDALTYAYQPEEGGEDGTTVEIRYGAPSPAWQKGSAEMKRLAGESGGWLVSLAEGSDRDISDAVWEEIVHSPAPPVHILVRKNMGPPGKKKADMHSESEITIDSSKVPRPVDFSIPPDYKWHTHLLLAMVWMF